MMPLLIVHLVIAFSVMYLGIRRLVKRREIPLLDIVSITLVAAMPLINAILLFAYVLDNISHLKVRNPLYKEKFRG